MIIQLLETPAIHAWYGDWWIEMQHRGSTEPEPTTRSLEPPRFPAEQKRLLRGRRAPRPKRGLILGRFLPPHRGHQFLVDFASTFVERLTLVLCSNSTDPIPPETRLDWLGEMFPSAQLLHEPDSAGRSWADWEAILHRRLPWPVDCLFASEPPALELAERLGARFVCVDPERRTVPISGTRLRAEPLQNWDYLPPCVRPHYVLRVVLLGAEGIGKSTLARELALRYRTVCVEEAARSIAEERGGKLWPEDLVQAARRQAAAAVAAARQANRLLIQDTDALQLEAWSERLFGTCPPWLREEASATTRHLVLMPALELSERGSTTSDRALLHERIRRRLVELGTPPTFLFGTWGERFELACATIDPRLSPPPLLPLEPDSEPD